MTARDQAHSDQLHTEALRAQRWVRSSVVVTMMAELTARMPWSQVSPETRALLAELGMGQGVKSDAF